MTIVYVFSAISLEVTSPITLECTLLSDQEGNLIKERSAMLRITTRVTSDTVCLGLEGRLAGIWVRQLDDCWQHTKADQPDRAMQVDLAAVIFIDEAGQCLLRRMYQEGVRLCAAGSLNKYVIADIRRSAIGLHHAE